MLATVPLTTAVKSLTSARALAESVALADPEAHTGQAVDRVARFLAGLTHESIVHNVNDVLDVFDLLTREPALRMTSWLATHCSDPSASPIWRSMHDLIASNALPLAAPTSTRPSRGLRARGVWHPGPDTVIYAKFGWRDRAGRSSRR